MTEPNRPQGLLSRYNLLSLYLPAAVMALGSGIALPVLPVFAKSFDISFSVATLVVIISHLGSALATVPTGYLVDRVGRRPILLAGPILTAIASFLTAFAQSFPELLVYRFIGGCAQQMWMLSRLAIISDTGVQRQRGRQITGMVSMDSAGRLLAPALGGFIAALWDIRAPFIIHGALALLSIIPSVKIVQETGPRGSLGEGRPTANFRQNLAGLLIYPVLMLFLAQLFASLTRGTLFGGTLNIYAVYAYDIGPEVLGILATITGVFGIPITLTAGYLMDHFGRKASVVPGFTLLCFGLVAMAATAQLQSPFAIFVVVFFFVHAAQSMTSGNMMTLGSDLAPAHLRGQFFGIWRLVGEIGMVLSPTAFALLSEFSGYLAAFMFLSICSGAAAFVLVTQIKETLTREPRPSNTPIPAVARAATGRESGSPRA